MSVDRAVIHGPAELSGAVRPGGFKHSMVLLAAAAVAVGGRLRLSNCPEILETDVLGSLLRSLGASTRRAEDVLEIDCGSIGHGRLQPAVSGQIHGSAYLLPGLLGRFGEASGAVDGGCPIGDDGARPTSHYVSVLERFGALAAPSHGGLQLRAGELVGCEVDLLDYTDDRQSRTGPHYSGATKTAILAAACASGTSVLEHPYLKRDVLDLLGVLEAFGVDVDVDGEVIRIGGRPADKPAIVHWRLVPDLIETVTWLVMGALTSPSGLLIEDPRLAETLDGLTAELTLLEAIGVDFQVGPAAVAVRRAGPLRSVDVHVDASGIFSDSLPLFAVLLSVAGSPSTVVDGVWKGRYGYAEGLAAMGAGAAVRGRTLDLTGRWTSDRRHRDVEAGDLRAAAALVTAALHREGTTTVHGTHHLRRGYDDLLGQLRRLGADVQCVPA